MATQNTFVVQAFVLKRGQIAPGPRESAPTQAGAVKRAESWAPGFAGTAALFFQADDDTGEVSDAEILSRHGCVPDDLIERIREG